MKSVLEKIRTRLGPLRWHALLLSCIWRVGDLANLVCRAVLGRKLDLPEFGGIEPVLSTLAFFSIPIVAIYRIGAKSISRLLESQRHEQCTALVVDLAKISAVGSVISVAVLFILREYILERLHLKGDVYVYVFACMFVLAWWSPLASSVIQGSRRFALTSISTIGSPLLVLALTLVFVGGLSM